MKATDVIRRDHQAIENIFNRFKSAPEEEREVMQETIFDALTHHENMEDEYFYPALFERIGTSRSLVKLKAEQLKLKAEVVAARALPGDRPKRILKMMKTVLAHARREEKDILPAAEDALAGKLEALGEQMEPRSAVANQD